jgi:hypothetical protein
LEIGHIEGIVEVVGVHELPCPKAEKIPEVSMENTYIYVVGREKSRLI